MVVTNGLLRQVPIMRSAWSECVKLVQMDDAALIAETNRLLKRFFEMRQEEKEAAAKHHDEHEAWKAEQDAKFEASMREKLEERGASVEGFDGTMEDWEARMKAVQAQAKEKLEAEKAKEREYKDRMLEAMQAQSGLLRRIAEKMDA